MDDPERGDWIEAARQEIRAMDAAANPTDGRSLTFSTGLALSPNSCGQIAELLRHLLALAGEHPDLPVEGPRFLFHVIAGDGVRPHPLDTHSVMLPEGCDVYGLLADACRLASDGEAIEWMEPTGPGDAVLRKLAGHFDRLRDPR
jgi:hypothetical protein